MKYLDFPSLSLLSQSLTHSGPECSVQTRIEAYSCKNVKRDKRLFRHLEATYRDELAHSPPRNTSDSSLESIDTASSFPPYSELLDTPLKTLHLLIATLNIAFPDHEFSDVRPAHFTREDGGGAQLLNALSKTMMSGRSWASYPFSSTSDSPPIHPTRSSPVQSQSPMAPPQIVSGTHPALFRVVDEAIGGIEDCEVWSYNPGAGDDPHDADDDSDYDSDDEDSDDWDETFSFDEDQPIPRRRQFQRQGALLWSAHWFFINKKLKRVLFVSIWARATHALATQAIPLRTGYADEMAAERFHGWEGGVGAGARALGIRV
ncbi:Maf1-domain-containing protein [Mycena floridula]|nr:Maf1-domain-containing protein [Mycena floridula]